MTDNETKVDVVDVVQLLAATSEGMYKAMMNTLIENKLPLNNWAGFCSDTTNVMMGDHQSVSTLIHKNHPGVVIVKCSCHSIHLVASYACKKLSNSLEDLVRTIYNHFKRSAKRTAAFADLQKFCEPKKKSHEDFSSWANKMAISSVMCQKNFGMLVASSI